MLLLTGVVLGGAAVVLVQEEVLPPRLSSAEGASLRSANERVTAERDRLAGELAATAKRLETTLAQNKVLADELGASRASVERLREGMATAVTVLPPDPRGGAVEVRAARFSVTGGTLGYSVLLSRERAAAKTLDTVVQFVVAGETARGSEGSVTLGPVAVSIASHEVAGGSLPLPAGFQPRQATVQVLDRPGGRLLGMRVILVK